VSGFVTIIKKLHFLSDDNRSLQRVTVQKNGPPTLFGITEYMFIYFKMIISFLVVQRSCIAAYEGIWCMVIGPAQKAQHKNSTVAFTSMPTFFSINVRNIKQVILHNSTWNPTRVTVPGSQFTSVLQNVYFLVMMRR